MKNYILYFITGLTSLNLHAQNFESIPDSLKVDAVCLILDNSETLEIFSKNKFIHSTKSKSLVLKNEDNSVNNILIYYNQFDKVENIEIKITDISGKKIKTIKKKDFQDIAYQDGFTIASDSRYLVYRIIGIPTPYIVEKEIVKTSAQTFSLPGFSPYEGKNISILKSEFRIINHDITNKLYFYNPIGIKFDTIFSEGKLVYSTVCENHSPKLLYNKYSKKDENYVQPMLSNFSMENKDGSFYSWKDFGKWIWELSKETGELNEASKKEIQSIIMDAKNNKEKLNRLYSYLQQNMRYVSIQLGIGGWKPMNVQQVHDFKYGDCKALSNYMKHVLNVAGIPSKYVIINAGVAENLDDTTLVRNSFNHAILAAFPDNDTVFLECTSSKTAAGYLGSFTGNRHALMIDGENSKIIKTKEYSHQDNVIENIFEIDIENHNVLHSQLLKGIGIEHKGLFYMINLPPELLLNHLMENGNDINELKLIQKELKNDLSSQEINISTSFQSRKKILKTGSRYFVDLNFDLLPVDLMYKNPDNGKLHVFNGFSVSDHYDVKVPQGCYIEKLPKETSFESEAGYIQSSIINLENGSFSYKRNIVIKKGKYSLEKDKDSTILMDKLRKVYTDKIVVNCRS